MAYLINLTELSLPVSIHYEAPESIRTDLAERFEFDGIESLSGDFTLIKEEEHYVLEGTYNSQVVLDSKTFTAKEVVKLFLLTSETQEAQFDLTDDLEILVNLTFDLEEVIAQYLYLEITDRT